MHQKITQKAWERKQYDEQTEQLTKLINIFEESNAEFQNSNEANLTEQQEAEINQKFEEIVQTISNEYNVPNLNELEKTAKKLCTMKSEIEKEITILKEVDGQWENDESLSSLINDYSGGPPFEPDSFCKLSSINFSDPQQQIQIANNIIPFNPPRSKVQQLQLEIEKIVSVLQSHEFISNSLYSAQLDFFTSLKDTLLSNPITEDDVYLYEQQIQDRLKLMSKIFQISPIVIPHPTNDQNPLESISEQFTSLCEYLNSSNQYSSLSESLHKLAEQDLSFPEFSIPTKPQYTQKSIQNSSLIELSCKLQELTQRTSQMIPLQILQSLASTHCEALSITQSEIDFSDFEPDLTLTPQKLTPIHERGHTESPEITHFKQIFLSKMPDELQASLSTPQISLTIPHFEDESPQQSSIDSILSESENNEFNNSIHTRSGQLNTLLRTMTSLDTPPIPTVGKVPVSQPRENINTGHILSIIDELLDPTQYERSVLLEEINQLSNKLELLQQKYSSEEEEQVDESLSQIISDVDALTIQVNSQEERYTKEFDELRLLATKRSEIIREINDVKEQMQNMENIDDAALDEMEKEVTEMRKALVEKKQNFKEEMELRRKLLEQQNEQSEE
ncbi:hypothetical protein GPJ56_009273 [Histomonas meleagridis]|uniref:uncharacterized protein n=1 Tax=Histomonas meleagridis TaxID=135588 RepID=UPI003559C583|nr:hypothetical protein GPJ56_009273 [Histomonas meleagridis]KAH0801644.1 hypothetical protein GO595_005643 [Histomonas meleagridis]